MTSNVEQIKITMMENRKHHGPIIPGLILIALGIIFLLQQFFPEISFGKLWPVVLIIIGFSILYRNFAERK